MSGLMEKKSNKNENILSRNGREGGVELLTRCKNYYVHTDIANKYNNHVSCNFIKSLAGWLFQVENMSMLCKFSFFQ